MEPFRFFKFCPRCGQPQARETSKPCFQCHACSFVYYLNPAMAAAAFIVRPDGLALFVKRAKEPAKGKLAIPGGFIDIGETAEEALRREIQEEVNLEVRSVEYLCSFPNQYLYREVTYPVLDLFFTAAVTNLEQASALDDVESFSWLRTDEINLDDIAFPSIRSALQQLRRS